MNGAFLPADSESSLFYENSDTGAEHPDDSLITEMFFERNERALSAVREKYGAYCFRVIRNILESPQDAEECLNDTLMKMWESIPPEKPGILPAFMAKIARNLAIDRYRRNNSQKRGGNGADLIFEELEDCVSGSGSIEETAERREMLAAVNRFLEGLPIKKRIMFVSRYCLCESVRSTAKKLGMRENAVSASLARTRAALREYLKKEGYEI